MNDNQLYIELNQVIEKLKNCFALDGLRKSFTYETYLAKEQFEVEISHQYLEEIDRFLRQGHDMVIPSLLDMEPIFIALDKGGVLSTAELYSVADLLSTSESLYDLLYDKKEFYHLNDDALDLNPVTQLKRDLILSIEPDLTVSDNASSKLRSVRSDKRAIQRQLTNIMNSFKNRYSKYLSSDVISYKGGEEALPVKIAFKGEVKGSVVGYSSTGETVFMIPYDVIDLKSKLNSLIQEENTEIMKVLSDLSQKAFKNLKLLKRDYEIIFTFDRYLGAVRLGHDYNGVIAETSQNELSLNGFAHPLLKAKVVVRNNLTLGGSEPKTLLITGPNAGGKSILIKAVALCVLMDKLGLMIPCQDASKLPFIKDLFFLGGDNQSVMDNLSTFSSHLLGIKNVTENCKKDSLVIIDEVGEGTSPKDGEAIGVALLKYFEKVGCLTLLTSHFDGMKTYAVEDEMVLTGAMEFNTTGMKPTYKLLLHTTGKSYGILLAKQMGLAKEIVDDAVSFQNSRVGRDTDALLEKLTEQISINEKKQKELETKMRELDRAIEKKDKATLALNEEKNAIKQKAEKKVERLVEERIAEINKIWEGKTQQMTYSEVSQVKGELKQAVAVQSKSVETHEKVEEIKDLKAGEMVEDEDHRKAKVLEVNKNECTLDMDGLRIRRKIRGLKRIKVPEQPKAKKKNQASLTGADMMYLDLSKSGGMELNVIGLHVDEAMRKVVSFLDNARVRKLTYVRIIHGTGTFALKNAIWKYLANHKEFIRDYEFGGEGDGGLGATCIHLK